MRYGLYPSASGANTGRALTALVEYFGYDKSAVEYDRDWFDIMTWKQMLYDELMAKRPVLYSGQSSSGGHAFVLDGYRASDGFFHINWGWGGYQDGYFLVTDLNPYGGGIGSGSDDSGKVVGYNLDQQACFGIQPPQEGKPYEPVVVVSDEMSVRQDIYSRKGGGGYVYFDGSFTTPNVVNFNAYFGIKLTASNGDTFIIPEGNSTLEMQKNRRWLSMYIYSNDFPIGEFVITPVYKVEGSDEWKDMLQSSAINAAIPVVCTKKYLLFNGAQQPEDPYTMEFVSITPTDSEDIDEDGVLHFYKGHYYNFTYRIKNNPNNTESWSENMRVYMQASPGSETWNSCDATLTFGSNTHEYPYEFTAKVYVSTTKEVGTYTVALWSLVNGRFYENLLSKDIEVEEVPAPAYSVKYVSTIAEDPDDQSGTSANFKLGHNYVMNFEVGLNGETDKPWQETLQAFLVKPGSDELWPLSDEIIFNQDSHTYPYNWEVPVNLEPTWATGTYKVVIWRMRDHQLYKEQVSRSFTAYEWMWKWEVASIVPQDESDIVDGQINYYLGHKYDVTVRLTVNPYYSKTFSHNIRTLMQVEPGSAYYSSLVDFVTFTNDSHNYPFEQKFTVTVPENKKIGTYHVEVMNSNWYTYLDIPFDFQYHPNGHYIEVSDTNGLSFEKSGSGTKSDPYVLGHYDAMLKFSITSPFGGYNGSIKFRVSKETQENWWSEIGYADIKLQLEEGEIRNIHVLLDNPGLTPDASQVEVLSTGNYNIMSETEPYVEGDNVYVIPKYYSGESLAFDQLYRVRASVNNTSMDPAVYLQLHQQIQTGVEDVVVDGVSGEAVYYDLQGRRVEHPAPGMIYVRVADGRAVKVKL